MIRIMKRTPIALGLAAASLAAVMACSSGGGSAANSAVNLAKNAAAPAAQPQRSRIEEEIDKAPRISIEEAKRDLDAGIAVFIDTHPKDQFEQEHIPGAINLQVNTIKQNLDKVPRDKKLIVYCS